MTSNHNPPPPLGRATLAVSWVALLGVMWFVFDGFLDQRDNPNRSMTVQANESELVLRRNRAGHYVAPGTINGQRVEFLLDTGATQVSVPAHLGSTLGLTAGTPMQTMTANGTVTVNATTIDELQLGPFQFRQVRGHLNPGFRQDQILLGMTVLSRLDFSQSGDTLTLRVPGN